MSLNMNIKLSHSYLKYYFDNYFVKVDKETLAMISNKLKENANIFYLKGDRDNLLQAGFCFLAHNHNYKECMKIRSYDLLEFFFSRNEMQGLESFYNIEERNLIIYHLAGTTANNRLISLVRHVATFRALEGKNTLILSEEDIINELQDGQTKIINLRDNTEDLLSDI